MDGNGSFRPDDATPRPPRPGPPQRHRVARRRSSPTPRQGALLTGLTLVAAVLVGITITTPSGGAAPSGSPGVARATAGPSDGGGTGSNAPVTPPPGGPTPVTTPEPTVDPAGWSAVDLPPYEPVADLAPTRTEPGGASIDTAFVLTSRSGPAADLAKHLEVVPPVDLAVARGGTAASVRLTPVVPLDQGTTYRFALRLADGSLAGSWVYQTGSAPRVARTLPADKRTNVPVDTGIEITWDQDGVGNLAPYFSISPKVGGRFERHGRTAVFVPDALQPRTVYTVTVRRGVDLEGSRLVLDRDVTFQFETRAKDGTKVKRPRWLAAEPLVESPTGSAPLISVSADRRITRVDVRVHRLPTLEGAVRAYLALRDAPDWAQRSDTGVVPVAGLARVARFSVPVNHWPSDGRDGGWIKFPDSLPAGWYLVTIPRDGRDVQLVLQVTDVQATAITGSGRTVIWAHDLAAGGPLGGATVRGLDRGRFGRTAADGLLVAPTPARLATADLEAAPRDRIIVVRAAGEEAGAAPRPDRTLFLPVDAWASDVPFRDRFWRLLYTDRSLFRSTDTIEAWGVLQPRSGGAAPAAELRLVAGGCWDGYDDEGESCADVAIVRAAVRPDASTGVFTASVPIAGVPAGDYELALYVDDLRAAGTHLAIGVIRKPAYRLDVVTDRTVVVAGDRLVATATASFFDGTPAPGVAFVVGSGFEDDEGEDVATRTTGADGRGDAVVPVEINDGQWAWREVAVWPEGPEEASISASTSVLAFASRVVLDGEATLDGPSLAIAGSLHQVDLERLEGEVRAGLDQEIRPNGAAVAGATVRIRIEERWQVKVPTGRVYDFIAKKAIDTYEYRDRERSLGTRRVTTDANGRFALETDVASDHWYTIDVLADDADGRTTRLDLWAEREEALDRGGEGGLPTLTLDGNVDADGERAYAVGDPIRATIRGADGAPMPTGGDRQYLFFTARPGHLDARVEATPRLRSTFTEADIPGLSIGAAWFDGTTGGVTSVYWGCGAYLPTVEASFDTTTRALEVELEADAARYRPGETATVAIRTTDAAGRPVAADVILRAVDEKLYAIGGALEGEALDELYWSIASGDGLAATAGSHSLPVFVPFTGETCGPGTTGGGGEDVTTRDDFRDTLLFRRVRTGADGRATASFDLSDDLTSWRVSATAIGARKEVGQGTVQVPVALPLFVEAPLAPDYLTGDRPRLRVRAYGEALTAGDRVTFTVSAPSLGMATATVVGRAFEAVEVPMPRLVAGDHAVTIEASAGTGAAAARDRLVRTIRVVDTRFTQRRTAYGDLADGLPDVAASTSLVDIVFADAGRARHLGTLEELADGDGARLDQALAAAIARDLLVTTFDVDPARFDGEPFDPAPYLVRAAGDDDDADYEIRGLALLPYAGADEALSARAALLGGARVAGEDLADYFRWLRSAKGDAEFEDYGPPPAGRESRSLALAGLAGLGEPVVPAIRAALADPDLTIRERLYLALGAAALGDHATALRVERDLLTRHGERMGPWLRLRVGSSLDDTIEATALVALIGATVGDPVAEWAEAYVEANPARDDLMSLQRAGYVERVLARTPAAAARVAYAVDGSERTVAIPAGDALSLTLTPAQWATFRARTVAGKVDLAVSWDAAVDPGTLATDPSFTLRRTVTPGPVISSSGRVEVTLTATFGPQAVRGCYDVTDTLPSGLAPFGDGGQRVTLCLDPKAPSASYRARVVTPGTYRWEPAILQLEGTSESLALTPDTTVEIR